MEEGNKKIIQGIRQICGNDVRAFRKQREKHLHKLCIELGGHDFWPQQKILRECVDPSLNRFVEVRECSCCGFREEQEIEEKEKTIKEEQ